ncbi:MAG: hypothetical protein LBG07_05745 [Treponema sp.]|jgi:hypothetical protein|nr:hypothetical protein [Treponema sp.]
MKAIKFSGPLKKRAGIILFLLGVPVLLAAFFLSRPPALILSDAGFDALYGPGRTLFRQAGLSLRFFRRVKRVLVAEDANPEATVFAIEEGAAEPWAVLGHARYRRGLDLYARQYPDVRVVLIREDVFPDPAESASGPESVFIDTRLNSWRAGRCAAMLAGEGRGQILVFQDRQDFPVNREAFLAGLREENEALIPLYLSSAADYSFWDDVRCVVLGGPGDLYFNRNSEIPALLFTWMDPALSPGSVKITVDDSLWALASEALRFPGGDSGGYRSLPARFTVLRGSLGDRELGKKLKKALRLQIPASLFQ